MLKRILLIIGLLLSLNAYGKSLEPFEFKIEGFPNVEVLDIAGDGEDHLVVLCKNKYLYEIDLDHKKVISSLYLGGIKNPIRFAQGYWSSNTLILDKVSDRKYNIISYNQYNKKIKVLHSVSKKIIDIIYTDGRNIALLTKENDLYSFSVKKDGTIRNKMKFFGMYDDTEEKINRKYHEMINLSKNISNVSSKDIKESNVYSFVSQKEKTIYMVDGGNTYKITTDKVPNVAYPIGCCLYTLKYMIIAYKGEKGLSFNKVNTSYNKDNESFLSKVFSKLFCLNDYHSSELEPLFKKLAINLQKEFLRKNKNNKAYTEHPSFESWLNYDYVNKEETFKIIEETLGCKMTQPNPYYSNVYKAECMTPNGLAYELEAFTNGGHDIGIQTRKDKTSCYVDFKTRRFIDFKEKSEGKNAGYEGYCKESSCFNLGMRQ